MTISWGLSSSVARPTRRAGHSLALDGLRGLAVLAVVAFHTGVLPFGWLGVPVFFVLSGHFITRILLERRTGNRSTDLGNFLRNRALRLAPLYLLACVALTVLAVVKHGPKNLAGDLPFLWTWTYDFRPVTAGYVDNNLYDHLWSLGVEVQLYLVWAALALLLPRRWFTRVLVALAVGGPVVRVLVWLAMVGFGPDQRVIATYELPTTYLDAFAIGALTALPEVRARLPRPARVVWVVAGLTAVICVVELVGVLRREGPITGNLHFPIAFPRQLAWIWGYSLIAALTGAIVLVALGGSRPLSWRPLAWVGLISYGVYVGHRPVLELGKRLLPGEPSMVLLAGLAVAVVLVSLGLAAVSYRWFERPFMSRKRNALSTTA
ncbi:Peptidoglycan/LPS O-acetylase OafA/YrhL, contains acyltransferase and SGNH-hydrolase domains [Amycolatopsis sacchari]|uniref:Peptidoglycan/LPS O-acetylase OafA/YrhL, contains acyltransferase and SGNH-hydrolase domains n=1 Tax=Amycolatopsis sacchari TaxID=115433 RepID=A0A1I4A4Q3_9PSEU|nr:acyltransferase [Amycolatopsis sacchari]SFK51313.1 Peptidoglycan/LPS O-acetylase OafA/YrhL, contains acyltransferase and SGNH-hydrolase domains [Amycolatopsis sacchari]